MTRPCDSHRRLVRAEERLGSVAADVTEEGPKHGEADGRNADGDLDNPQFERCQERGCGVPGQWRCVPVTAMGLGFWARTEKSTHSGLLSGERPHGLQSLV